LYDTFAIKSMSKVAAKKKNNIAEYIIHMYQTEDLIRTFEFDLNKINSYVITNIPVSVSEKKELILWYASLIESMQSQKITTTGHLLEIEDLIKQLTELHNKLIETDEEYKKRATIAEPFIKNQIKKSDNLVTNPVKICLNAIYGFLLLKLDGKNVSDEQQKMLDTFGDVLSYLSFKFKK